MILVLIGFFLAVGIMMLGVALLAHNQQNKFNEGILEVIGEIVAKIEDIQEEFVNRKFDNTKRSIDAQHEIKKQLDRAIRECNASMSQLESRVESIEEAQKNK